MAKPVRLRRLAADDIESAVAHLLAEAGPDVATRIINAAEAALEHIGRHPHHGTPRFSYELDIPGLRAWPPRRCPYLAAYVQRSDVIDVWRIRHTRRDIPVTLAEDDDQ